MGEKTDSERKWRKPQLFCVCLTCLSGLKLTPSLPLSFPPSLRGNLTLALNFQQTHDRWQPSHKGMDLNFPTMGGLRRLEDVSRSKLRTQPPGTQTLQKQRYKLPSPERLPWGCGDWAGLRRGPSGTGLSFRGRWGRSSAQFLMI